MRFANHDGRLTLIPAESERPLHGLAAIDLAIASSGLLPASPEQAFECWDEVLRFARTATQPNMSIDRSLLQAPSPRPHQIFGVGLNYADHGSEAGMDLPEIPLIFTKLPPSITGPYSEIELSTASVDWEVELVIVVGRRARNVSASDAWPFIAGVTVGQDLSDRDIQWRPSTAPQFSLGKSLPGFAPLGPVLVTADEFPDPDDLEIACSLNGEEVQRSRTSNMIFPVGQLIEYLSGITTLLPGDVIFTGTPSGVGMSRTPPRYLAPGDTLDSHIEGVGTMSVRFAPTRAEMATAA